MLRWNRSEFQIINIKENSIAQISDKQATLVNKMAAKPEKLGDNNGTGSESTLVKKRSDNSEFLGLVQKLIKVGLERSKL